MIVTIQRTLFSSPTVDIGRKVKSVTVGLLPLSLPPISPIGFPMQNLRTVSHTYPIISVCWSMVTAQKSQQPDACFADIQEQLTTVHNVVEENRRGIPYPSPGDDCGWDSSFPVLYIWAGMLTSSGTIPFLPSIFEVGKGKWSLDFVPSPVLAVGLHVLHDSVFEVGTPSSPFWLLLNFVFMI